MLVPVLILAAWFAYVEIAMPNRTNECPYDIWECDDAQDQSPTTTYRSKEGT